MFKANAQSTGERLKAVIAFVNASSDDAVENLDDGTVNVCSEKLNLVSEFSHNLLGIRFTNLKIPKGAIVTTAKLVYKVDELNSQWSNLLVHAEYVDDAKTFEEMPSSITARATTKTTISLSDKNKWTHTNGWFTSSNISQVIQEVVNRSGWEESNSLALLIGRNGDPTAFHIMAPI